MLSRPTLSACHHRPSCCTPPSAEGSKQPKQPLVMLSHGKIRAGARHKVANLPLGGGSRRVKSTHISELETECVWITTGFCSPCYCSSLERFALVRVPLPRGINMMYYLMSSTSTPDLQVRKSDVPHTHYKQDISAQLRSTVAHQS